MTESTPMTTRITMTLLVRDEQDILAQNIRFHGAMGVDSFIVMDNLSTDGTRELIAELAREFTIDYLHQPDDTYDQQAWVTEMARKAATDHGADWVINSDADEFWVPETGDLKTLLSGLSAETGILEVRRHNAVVICGDAPKGTGTAHPCTSTVFETESKTNLGTPLLTKVLHRAAATVEVEQGNHAVSGVPGSEEAAGARLRILHYPYRTLEHYKAKIAAGGRAYAANTRMPKGVGATWRAHYAGLEDGTVDRFWHDLAQFDEDVTFGLLSHRFFRDETVVRFFREMRHWQDRMTLQAAAEELLARTRGEVETVVKTSIGLLERVPPELRPNRPAYYHLQFTVNGGQSQLRWLASLPDRASPEELCADFAALRDAFSLFPRNRHIKSFLTTLLQVAHPEDSARLRADCAGRTVILHASCLPRLDATAESVASFDALGGDVHHIILHGENSAHGEAETGLSFGYDGRFLKVPTPDIYESLHRKLFYAYMLFDLLAPPRLLVKIDDDMILQNPGKFRACLDRVIAEQADYAGRRVGAERHESQWHGWHIGKCADPVIDSRGYQYPLPRDYAAGGYGYVLAPRGLAACSYMYLAMKEFFAMPVVGLEDACVGHATHATGIDLLDISIGEDTLAFPGLDTKGRRRILGTTQGSRSSDRSRAG
ncbi:glycosyltransferase family 2 protein [Acidimangrovimonas pyrenivorans]|uniref:Glycosyltransferase family 2 protein n=1 Tax=Acidimangrovimonas pyrenivorans TaxID=2030798 RepID=A0ABV7AM53_9RHOB